MNRHLRRASCCCRIISVKLLTNKRCDLRLFSCSCIRNDRISLRNWQSRRQKAPAAVDFTRSISVRSSECALELFHPTSIQASVVGNLWRKHQIQLRRILLAVTAGDGLRCGLVRTSSDEGTTCGAGRRPGIVPGTLESYLSPCCGPVKRHGSSPDRFFGRGPTTREWRQVNLMRVSPLHASIVRALAEQLRLQSKVSFADAALSVKLAVCQRDGT